MHEYLNFEVQMKTFVKCGIAVCAIFIAWNCSNDESPSSSSEKMEIKSPAAINVNCSILATGGTSVWWLSSDKDYLISPVDYSVRDAQGNVIGVYDTTLQAILNINRTETLALNVVLSVLPVIDVNCTVYYTDGSVVVADTIRSSSSSASQIVTSPVATNVVCSALAAGGTSVWWLSVDGKDYLISPVDYSVRDAAGNAVGTYNTASQSIVDLSGTVFLAQGVDLMTLPTMDVNCNVTYPDGRIVSAVTGSSSSVAPASSADPVIVSSSSVDQISSSSAVSPVLSSSSQVILVSSSSNPLSSSSQVVLVSSSSSAAKSSSSVFVAGTCPTIKVVSGGRSGSGWATRYWDCCKPSCSWTENAGGNLAKTCDASGNAISDASAGSMCQSGPAGTCMSQIPFEVCDDVAYAFAAVPAADGATCGKCYMLTFTGEGKYSTDVNHKALKGKKLVVMVSNVGTDVSQGQFDIMIPGGGVGAYNGCSTMWGISNSNLGAQYGGFLSDCETSSNYKPSTYKSCLTNKCNTVFANNTKAREGCLFLANWMEAAGNPLHTYQEVECPQELKNLY